MESLFLEGLFLQASLIFALGAQNVFVLESGLNKQHPLAISFVCFFCDLVLIMIGVAGAGSLFSSFTQLKVIVGFAGAIFMFQYGVSKIFITQDVLSNQQQSFIKQGLKRSVVLAITFSILNPHAYLDAFILIGGYSTKYHILSDRVLVGLGAASFSLIWFLFLSSASSLMKPVFSNVESLRFVTTCSGVVLLFLSFKLGADVIGWITQGPHTPILVKAFNYPFPSTLTYSSILY